MKRILFLLTIALLNLGSGLCKTRQSLRIMSYNIRIGIGMDQQTNLKRIAEVINKIQPDYVGLQEVDSVCERSGWINQYAELARLTGMYPIFAPAQNVLRDYTESPHSPAKNLAATNTYLCRERKSHVPSFVSNIRTIPCVTHISRSTQTLAWPLYDSSMRR